MIVASDLIVYSVLGMSRRFCCGKITHEEDGDFLEDVNDLSSLLTLVGRGRHLATSNGAG